jgi:hypothetical protein
MKCDVCRGSPVEEFLGHSMGYGKSGAVWKRLLSVVGWLLGVPVSAPPERLKIFVGQGLLRGPLLQDPRHVILGIALLCWRATNLWR